MSMEFQRIYEGLEETFGKAKGELVYKDEYTLLVAVILSAQCTDKRVNKVTPLLFEKYPTVYDMASANIVEVEEMIHSCGFYHNKAKNIIKACQDIVGKYDGKVPDNLEDLISLNGVGRKTANVVLATAYNKPAIAVDTHVFRVSNRLGLSTATNPEQCEKELMNNIPESQWSKSHLMLVLHGRYICTARNPKCYDCNLKNYCEAYNENNVK